MQIPGTPLWVFGAGFLVMVALALIFSGNGDALYLILAAAVVLAGVAAYLRSSKSSARREQEAADLANYRASVEQRFGPAVASRLLAGQIQQGDTADMVRVALGEPAEIKQTVLKTKVKESFRYQPQGRGYRVQVHLENGIVVGWDM